MIDSLIDKLVDQLADVFVELVCVDREDEDVSEIIHAALSKAPYVYSYFELLPGGIDFSEIAKSEFGQPEEFRKYLSSQIKAHIREQIRLFQVRALKDQTDSR